MISRKKHACPSSLSLTSTLRGRAIVLLGTVAFFGLIFLLDHIGSRPVAPYALPFPHDDQLGEATLKVQASDLQRTAVVPTLDTPIIAGTNLIWCGTFQLAWNELGDLVDEEIHISPEHPMVAKLNRKELTHADLDETTYFVTAGIPGSRLYSQSGSATPPPASLATLSQFSQPIASAYAYLAVDLPFEWAFERLKHPLDFKGTKVKSFGIYQYLESQERERRAATQLRIYDRAHEHDVIIELVTRQTGHRLILAMVPIQTTLADTIQSVQARIDTSEPEQIGDGENLTIPLLDFDLTREYVELVNRPLNVSSRVLNGRPIGQATQNIRFKLDERGAHLRSAGSIAVFGIAPPLIFDKPFLIFLQYEGSDTPYFAAWIDNPELLVEF